MLVQCAQKSCFLVVSGQIVRFFAQKCISSQKLKSHNYASSIFCLLNTLFSVIIGLFVIFGTYKLDHIWFLSRHLKSDNNDFLIQLFRSTLSNCSIIINWLKSTQLLNISNQTNQTFQIRQYLMTLQHVLNEIIQKCWIFFCWSKKTDKNFCHSQLFQYRTNTITTVEQTLS